MAYAIDRVDVETALEYYPELWDTIKRELPTLSEEQWLKVMSIVLDTCPTCHNANTGCYCPSSYDI